MGSNNKAEANQSRRRFLKTGVVGGLAAVSLPALSVAAKRAASPDRPVDHKPSALDEITIGELAAGMKSGTYSARSITQQYLKRIEEIDKKGPALRSVIEINPEALAAADSLDQEYKTKGPRGPLHGIPLLIKDNIDTADRMETTAGSYALLGSKPQKDSLVAQRLRAAGAILLGKANLSEWANMRSTHPTSGWSARGGLTRNPYALDRNTSGSSSGSGAAVAANLCAAAVGTETDGSIVSPSSINGIIGIKPTVGLISRAGIIPISHSQDTAGPMARTVRDAAILLGAMEGVDSEDDATQVQGRRSHKDYTKFLDPNGLQGARIGVVRGYFGFLPRVDEAMESTLKVLKARGAVLVDPVHIDSIGRMDADEMTVLLHELKANMKKYLEHRGPKTVMHTLKDLIQFNEQHAEQEMPYFKQELFVNAEKTVSLSDQKYIDALEKNHRLSREEGIDAVMDKHGLDALVSPSESPAWMSDLVDGDHYLGGSSQLAAIAGYPHVTVPVGFVFGLPIGVSFFGRAWSEAVLLKIAYGFEQATRARKPPRFLPTVYYQ